MMPTADMVKRLRELTGSGMHDVKNALTKAEDDPWLAMGILRVKGLAVAINKRLPDGTTRPATKEEADAYWLKQAMVHAEDYRKSHPDLDQPLPEAPWRNAVMLHYLMRQVHDQPTSKQNLTARDVAWIEKQRESIRDEECGGGMCHEVTALLEEKWKWTRFGVSYLNADGEVICAGHYINVLPDGTIIDPTADQFGEGCSVRVLRPQDTDYGRYRPEFDSDFNPADASFPQISGWAADWHGEDDLAQQKRLEQERGSGWWLDDKTEFIAYWQAQLEKSDDFYRPYCEAQLDNIRDDNHFKM
jgi:hypothetical protein